MKGITGATVLTVVALGSLSRADTLTYDATDPRVGFNIWDPFRHAEDASRMVDQVNAMKADGFSAVTFIPMAYADLTSGQIQQTWSGDNYGSISDAELSAGIQRAKQLGMRVTVTPFVESRNRSADRATINFTTATTAGQTFWSDYASQYAHWAGVAQAAGADKFNIGSEMTALDTNTANAASWNNVITAARTQFQGKLGYTAQYWTFDSAATTSMIWQNSNIDYASLSAYLENQPQFGKPGLASLADAVGANSSSDAFVNTVKANFTNYLNDHLLKLGDTINKPTTIGEFGIAPFDTASLTPYKWWFSSDPASPNYAPYDPQEAINTWKGILEALDGKGMSVQEINAWVWGWQGGFPGERMQLRPGLLDDPSTTDFDESQTAAAANFLQSYVQTIPEPATLGLLSMAVPLLMRRPKRR